MKKTKHNQTNYRTPLLLGFLGGVLFLAIIVAILLIPRPFSDAEYLERLLPASLFSADIWQRQESTTDTRNRTRIELNRADPVSLVYLDFLRFDAVTPQAESAVALSERIDEAWITVALSNYSSVRRLKSCTIGDVRLYEYDVVINRLAYNLRYWVIPLTPTRVATLLVAVTVDNRPYFDELSQALRPNEVMCP